uniref:Uncharacterized protein n=1 Tax=Knipowitschia caucasica TaxID=637954 RepID=A0AAV2IY71_KNICA
MGRRQRWVEWDTVRGDVMTHWGRHWWVDVVQQRLSSKLQNGLRRQVKMQAGGEKQRRDEYAEKRRQCDDRDD